MSQSPLYGLMASFESSEKLREATRRVVDEGYTDVETFSPFPVEEIDDILGRRARLVPTFVLIGALLGASAAYLMMYGSWVWDYPINIGGRPMHSWPAYIPITFEMGVLFGAFSGFIGMLVLNRLPRLHHPVFEVSGFERATSDRFFLLIEAEDERFEPTETRKFLAGLEPLAIAEVPR